MLHPSMSNRVLNMPQILNMLAFWIYRCFEYTSVVNIPEFWICFLFWLCQVSGYTTVLNMPGLHRVLDMLEYAWVISRHAWLCPNEPKFVWIAFALELHILIPYLQERQTVFMESKNLIFFQSSWTYLILF